MRACRAGVVFGLKDSRDEVGVGGEGREGEWLIDQGKGGVEGAGGGGGVGDGGRGCSRGSSSEIQSGGGGGNSSSSSGGGGGSGGGSGCCCGTSLAFMPLPPRTRCFAAPLLPPPRRENWSGARRRAQSRDAARRDVAWLNAAVPGPHCAADGKRPLEPGRAAAGCDRPSPRRARAPQGWG